MVFTAGVLENNAMLRKDIINEMKDIMNIEVNDSVNDNIGYGHDLKEGIITTKESRIPFYVVPTSEEIIIARDTYRIVNK